MSRWEERALPILVRLNDSTDHYIREGILLLGYGDRGAKMLGVDLSDNALHDAVLQLADLGYVEYNNVEYSGGGGATITGLRVTGRGLQVLGQWPRFEALISPATLAEVIERLADYASPDEAPVMKKAAQIIRRVGASGLRSAAIGVGVQLLRGALGFP